MLFLISLKIRDQYFNIYDEIINWYWYKWLDKSLIVTILDTVCCSCDKIYFEIRKLLHRQIISPSLEPRNLIAVINVNSSITDFVPLIINSKYCFEFLHILNNN